MYGCFLCQEAPGDPVVLGNPAIALLGGAAGPAITPHIAVFHSYLRILTPTSGDVKLARRL